MSALKFGDRPDPIHWTESPEKMVRYSGGYNTRLVDKRATQVHHTGSLQTRVLELQTRDGRAVTLIGLVHFAEPRYFRRVEQLQATASVVFYEDFRGFSASWGKNAPGQRRTIQNTSLQSQRQFYQHAIDHRWQRVDGDAADFKSDYEAVTQASSESQSQKTQATGSDRTPVELQHLFCLSVVHFSESRSPILIPKNAAELSRDEFLKLYPKELSPLDYILIYRRNDIVLRAIQEYHSREDKTVVCLYGAAHLSDLQRRLERAGYSVKSNQWLEAITIPDQSPTLWEKLTQLMH